MIKVINLNFQNQTIENIEVDGEDIQHVELQLTKTKFKIVIKKRGETIKKEIKKKVEEEMVDLVMEVEEIDKETEEIPVLEPVMTIPVMEIPVEIPVMEIPVEIPVMEIPVEIPVMEIPEEIPITLEGMKELLKLNIPKPNTLESYYKTIKDVYNHFNILDMTELLTTKEQDIIKYIESKYDNNSTIKGKLCGFYKSYKILGIESILFKNKIDYYSKNQKIIQEHQAV